MWQQISEAVMRHGCSEDGGIVSRPQQSWIQEVGPKKAPQVDQANQGFQLHLEKNK